MAITWAEVVALSAELGDTPDAAQELILARVEREVDADAWGEFVDDGKRLLAAHLGTLRLLGGSRVTGPVTAETVGSLSRSYGTSNTIASSGDLAVTTFGQQYARLMRIACPFGLVP